MLPHLANLSAIPPKASASAAAALYNRSSVASLVTTIYDTLLTLAPEVQYIWSKPRRSLIKWLYLFVRYGSIASQTASLFYGTEAGVFAGISRPPYCMGWSIFHSVFFLLLADGFQLILFLRVYALYNGSKPITLLLSVLFAAANIIMITSFAISIPKVRYDDTCFQIFVPQTFAIAGAGTFLFDFALFVLTLCKFTSTVREGWNKTPLLTLVVRDGVWAFAVIFASHLIVAIVHNTVHSHHAIILMPWGLSIPPLVAAHLVLNTHALFGQQAPYPFASPLGQHVRGASSGEPADPPVTPDASQTYTHAKFTSFLAEDDCIFSQDRTWASCPSVSSGMQTAELACHGPQSREFVELELRSPHELRQGTLGLVS